MNRPIRTLSLLNNMIMGTTWDNQDSQLQQLRITQDRDTAAQAEVALTKGEVPQEEEPPTVSQILNQ